MDFCFSILCKARSKQHLAFLEAIAILLYYPTLCKQRRPFEILCLFGELGGNYENWVFYFFFSNSPPTTVISYFYLLNNSGVFCENTLDKRFLQFVFYYFKLINKYDTLTFCYDIYIFVGNIIFKQARAHLFAHS